MTFGAIRTDFAHSPKEIEGKHLAAFPMDHPCGECKCSSYYNVLYMFIHEVYYTLREFVCQCDVCSCKLNQDEWIGGYRLQSKLAEVESSRSEYGEPVFEGILQAVFALLSE